MPELLIPDDVYDELKLLEDEREETLKRELALSLYAREIISFGKARELAGVSRREFHRLLGEREIERHYTLEELDEDLEYASDIDRCT